MIGYMLKMIILIIMTDIKETVSILIDDLHENIEQKIKIFETKLEDETDKDERKFIEGNISGLRLAKVLVPLKETLII